MEPLRDFMEENEMKLLDDKQSGVPLTIYDSIMLLKSLDDRQPVVPPLAVDNSIMVFKCTDGELLYYASTLFSCSKSQGSFFDTFNRVIS
ncbi:MAG: hypothetical protein Sylvanvirus11_24 [Sylvanvirus sp.]|uniref:Uncharacterized protein n=1 Tax=Sylvanvirus sp. TaxID=2487774 RepID=A0A3G5AJT8_9VIRU|nr:MAG: hypothetical protein Sylvanvirus11_24 [Sylvanvirus sp.]